MKEVLLVPTGDIQNLTPEQTGEKPDNWVELIAAALPAVAPFADQINSGKKAAAAAEIAEQKAKQTKYIIIGISAIVVIAVIGLIIYKKTRG